MSFFRTLHRHLDPADSLGELIFGLIMVLTFTIGARLLGPEELTDGKELIIAAIGCNLAWGIIDGFLYVLGQLFERRRVATLMVSLRGSGDAAPAVAILEDEFENELTKLGAAEDRSRFYASIVAAARKAQPEPIRVTGSDIRAALLIFCLVVATAVPAALPFLVIDDPYMALRVSNVLLVGLLFVVGYSWGRHIGANPWHAGLGIMSIGLALVLLAIPLGG